MLTFRLRPRSLNSRLNEAHSHLQHVGSSSPMQSDEFTISHGSSPLVDVSSRLNHPIRGISPHQSSMKPLSSSALADSCNQLADEEDQETTVAFEAEDEDYMSAEDMEDVFSTHQSSQ